MAIKAPGYNVSAAVSAGFVKNDGSGNFSFGELGGSGGGGGVGTGWELIEVKDITVDTTSVTFSGLDGDTDGQYMLLYRIRKIPVTGSSRRVSIQPNGISTNQNSLGRFHDPSGNNATSSFTLLNIAAFSSGALQQNVGVLILDAKTGSQGRLYTADVATYFSTNVVTIDGQRRDHYAGVWRDSVTNITSLDFVSDFANGLGAGSQFCLYKKSSQTGGSGTLQLIETKLITVATNLITFLGLDGDTDSVYKMVYNFKGVGVGITNYTIRPNGITTSQASVQHTFANNGTHTTFSFPSDLRFATIGSAHVGGELTFYAETGRRRVYKGGHMAGGAVPSVGSAIVREWGGVWDETVTNITSLEIVASTASGIPIGSY